MTITPEELARAWKEAKRIENNGREQRLAIEREILSVANLKESGTNHFDALKIVTGYTETWSEQGVDKLSKQDFAIFPFTQHWKADPVRMKYIKQNEPDYYKAICKAALTLKEKKPAFMEK